MIRSFIQSGGILSDAIETLVVRVVGIGLMFGMTTLTARLLGADEFGAFSAAWALAILLATLAPIGSDRVLVRNLSTVRSPEEAGQDTAAAHICTFVIGVGIVAALGLAAVSRDFWNLEESWLSTAGLAVLLFIPISVTYLRQWVAIPLSGTRAAVIPEQISLPILFMGLMVLLHLSGITLTAVIAVQLFAFSMALVWLISILRGPIRRVYQSAWRSIPGPEIVRQRAREGIPFVSVAIGGVVLQRCLPVVIAAACGFRATALFAMALQYATVAEIPLGVVNLCMIPRCARHFQRGETDRAAATVRLSATMTFGLALMLAITVWIIGPSLIQLLGRSFQGIESVLPILLLAAIVNSVPGPVVPVMHTMKLESLYSRMLFAFLPVQLLLIWAGCRLADLEGAALAYFAGRIIWNVSLVVAVRKTRGILCLPFTRFEDARYFLKSRWPDADSQTAVPDQSLAA